MTAAAPPRRLHLNVNAWLQGFVPSAWRVPENDPLGFVDVRHYVRVAQIAEAGKFDAIFLADSVSTDGLATGPVTALEPTLVLTAIAGATTHLGLIGTASTSYNEPYNIARRFASLDLISGGRAGWNIVTTADLSSARNYGHANVLGHAERYRRAAEFTDVVKALWNSWEDDALIGDPHSGRFADPGKLHPVAHQGEFFAAHGILNQPRSRQGHPVLVQAGGSADGQALAARHAEAVFSLSQSLPEAVAYAQGLKQGAQALGRQQGSLLVFPGLGTFIGGTEAEARHRHQELIALVPIEHSLRRLAGRLGVAPERLDLDKPLPQDLPLPNHGNGGHTFFKGILARSRQHGLTLRQFLGEFAAGGGHREIVGTPEQVADDIEHWFKAGAADGFNLMPGLLPSGLQDFVEQVVPILQKRGLFRTDYEGSTLREHLGLARPGRAATRVP
ncbi:LLM class flavin-dependent oxidoreductase [Corticibacter populi]|uniref:LLM class flavin-dependent oxidoreductase n=1 Tax=Corticibacter populi TaxID=1550736 RepID=A0A3M6QU16_9BURK|nr:LLM class flavin-dependent oxidoreductase [Corticibacter populi]RMX06453.1 LLM class flavin-dependent oxidoreductase [Corticibacter populi]RZS31992.1 FMN-dependent oxidoreductase (nitrilotriacetate monooxygenase family) [Corticibacter populi]